MHKEVVNRRKAPVIALTLCIITLMIYLYEGISYLNISDIKLVKAVNVAITVMTICLILFEIFKCSISYKYSIIANKLIINKICLEKEKNVESINIANIVYVGEKANAPNKYKAKYKGCYLFRLLKNKTCCCVYKKGEEYYKFNFAPSSELLRRLHITIK